jgi:type IV secretory pathway component VirB8
MASAERLARVDHLAADDGRVAIAATLMTEIPAIDYRARPVKEAELAEHYAQGWSFLAQQRKWRRDRSILGWIEAPVVVALSIALACMMPLRQLVYVALLLHPDGTVDVAQTPSTIPITYEQSVVESELLTYVTCREGYNYADAQHCFDVVEQMSARPVREAYEKWFLPSNPYTPQSIGRDGQIDIKRRSIVFDKTMQKTAFIRFDKTVIIYGQRTVTHTYTAVISFELNQTIAIAARTFDPGALIVTSWQITQEGA